jgi:DNA-binding ferritin-like protein
MKEKKTLKKPSFFTMEPMSHEKKEEKKESYDEEHEEFVRMLPIYLSKLMGATTKGHLAHLTTESYSVHKALDDFYKGIVDLVDSVVEQIQGKYEKLIDISIVTANSLKTTREVVEYLNSLYELINEMQEGCNSSEIINTLDEIKSLINKTKYKLLFLK